jgi:cell fate regulator YaaT (PSP1 superfamily)
MPIIVGISLRVAGKIYSFDPGAVSCFLGERVLVETARGVELGTVRQPPHEVPDEQVTQPLKRVLRPATAEDLQKDAGNRDREMRALDACKHQVERLNLPMRLIDAQYTFDGSHILINFQAESRVDFRELVRELGRELHTRIELRQVGVRDEAKLLDGYGMCGRRLCCSAFLTTFAPVGINMAKAQGLALNPQKISGTCGRLMCCLAFEYEHYSELRVGMPKMNAHVDTPHGPGKVTKVNALARQVEITFPSDDTPVWYNVDELQPATAASAPPCAAGGCGGCSGHGEHGTPPTPIAAAPVALLKPTGDETDGAAPRRRNRRRRPRNPDAPESAGQPAGTQPTPAADNDPAKRARPRSPAQEQGDNTATRPTNSDGETPATDASNPNRPFPPGRYRPRRRR